MMPSVINLFCGLCQQSAQKKLLTEENLTSKRACEIAQAMELAEQNGSQLQSPDKVNQIVQIVSEGNKFKKQSQICRSSHYSQKDRLKAVTSVEDATELKLADSGMER